MSFTFKLSRRLSQVRMWMLVGALFGACSDQQGINGVIDQNVASNQVASIEVSPGSTALNVSQSAQFAATIRDTRGTVLAGVVTWSSSDPAIVTVTSTGVGTAIRAGTATIRASSNGKTGSSSVIVTAVSPPPPGQAPDTAVATVTVSPASATVSVLGTWQFTAIAKNAAGGILTGRQLSWSSSAPLIASVNSNGFATGVLGGSATITASVSGRSGSASVTVTAVAPPPPPPPTGGWTNEPAGFTNLTENPFNALTAAGWGIANNAGNTSIASDAGAPGSPSSVIEFKYPSGYAGGTAPATAYYSMPLTQNLYAGFWWKPSAGWQGHNSNVNKVAFFYSDVGPIYLAMYGPPGGPYQIRVEQALVGMGLPVIWYTSNVNPVNVTLGAWHKIEWLVNGTRLQFWMDGTLLGDYSTFPIVTGGWVEFQLSPTWGGMGDNKAQTDYYWYDHVRLSK